MKKEEMIKTMLNRFESMNDEGVENFFNLVMMLPVKEKWLNSTTPERIAELNALNAQRELKEAQEKEQAQAEADQKAEEKRNQIYHDFAKMFDAIHTVEIPDRYDISVEELKAIDFICGNVSNYFPEYAFSVAGYYFNYGFSKGIKYAKAQARKKAQKKGSH